MLNNFLMNMTNDNQFNAVSGGNANEAIVQQANQILTDNRREDASISDMSIKVRKSKSMLTLNNSTQFQTNTRSRKVINDSISIVSDVDSEHSRGSFTKKLQQIEKQINKGDLSKREKRLLQNRKSALKCRLKK